MFDSHCHILPSIDDGPATLQESLIFAQELVNQGITHVLASPHHQTSRYQNNQAAVQDSVSSFRKQLHTQQLPLEVIAGQEIRLTGDLIASLKNDELQCFGLQEQYLLIEFPTLNLPLFSEQICFELRSLGKIPIIVHPERQLFFQKEPNRLVPFLELGCLAQVTAPSYLGHYGKKCQKAAKQMIQYNLVQLLASDAHGIQKRPCYLKAAYQAISSDWGLEKSQQLQRCAFDLLQQTRIDYPEYQEVPKKRFLFFEK